MNKHITLVEDVIPRFKERSKFENDRVYVDYLYETINKALDGGHNGESLVSSTTSPTYRIKSIYESNNENLLTDKQIKGLIKHAGNIRKIKTSLCQRGTTADKTNFYLCWSLYEQGLTWSNIYQISDNNCSWNSDSKETIILKLKRMAIRFDWERS
ncbi:hypothetical protein OAE05_03715 [Gammaproteobacteria bacterium]|nr:hypothetical protein [Gammaproteobacteria bacterium]